MATTGPRTRRERLAAIADRLGPFARPHRPWLVAALAASVVVTAAQLALPWPLAWMVDLARTGERTAVPGWRPGTGQTMLAPTVALIAVGVVLGLAEYAQRVAVARYVVQSVNDARVGILAGTLGSVTKKTKSRDRGDVVARVVNDTARLRVGMKGVLVHIPKHGLFVLGVLGILLGLDPWLGLTYLAGLSSALGIAVVGSDRAAAFARRRRARESRVVDEALRAATTPGRKLVARPVDRERSVAIVRQVKGRTSWAVQGALAVTACLVLALAVRFSESGRLSTGDLAMVSSYLLMLHYPMMVLGRQISRLGPQLTSAERLARLAEPTPARAETP